MKVPLSWIKDFVDITLPLEELGHILTMAGLEVEEIHHVGLALPHGLEGRQELKITGIEWDPEKIVVGAILEVMPHPNADRLVLCRLDDGQLEHIVLTGAPNLFSFKGKGPLEKPIKVAYAKEGARLYDGHQPGPVLMTLKRAKNRGVESYSMACSEKELGISEDHEGIIFLDEEAPVGASLSEYMGDAVLDIAITPNLARAASMIGVAREIAALTGQQLRRPDLSTRMEGPSIEGRAAIKIREPELNPRFVLGLIENVEIRPSPYEVQRRLRLAGMRPINNIVDATNYAMLELGEPLHAFDYDVLVQRAGGRPPTILTRTALPGERLTTLDGVEHSLDDSTVLVCDTAGALSIAGVMGGAESEVSDQTRNILLEGAAWNFINIRRTLSAQHMSSEAAYRFSRGVHPSMAERGVRRGLELMRRWSGGLVGQGLIDAYPLPPEDPTVVVSPKDAKRWLGIQLKPEEIAGILRRLEFTVDIHGNQILATAPDHRLDIGQGVIGAADLMEEVARIYGYERIPETRLAGELPPQRANPSLEREERVRDLLVALGLQEVVTYRMTSPEREARLLQEPAAGASQSLGDLTLPGARPYVRLINPIVSDRNVMRQSLLSSVLEVVERNARIRERLAWFEVGPVFLGTGESALPDEPARLAFILTGPREPAGWQPADASPLDFYDLKGTVSGLLDGLHVSGVTYEPVEHPTFHPGRCARVVVGERVLGVMGEMHPLVRRRYEMPDSPLLAAEFDLEAVEAAIPDGYPVEPVPAFPPGLEDLAVIVEEELPAARVEQLILQAGGTLVTGARLFDVYRGEQAGVGKKSLAYSLTYQAPERTLTDQEVAAIRQRIIRSLESELSGKLRS